LRICVAVHNPNLPPSKSPPTPSEANERKYSRTVTYTDGSVYVGELKGGERNGQGTITFGKGDFEGHKYVGEWKDGERWNGKEYDKKGKILWKWKDGIKTGLL